MKLGMRAIAASIVISSSASLMIMPSQQRIIQNAGQATMITIAPQNTVANTTLENTSLMNTSYVKKVEVQKKAATPKVPSKYKIKLKTSANLNLRKNPNTNCSVLMVAKKGTVVYAEKIGSEFVHVYVNGKQGYMSARYLRKDGKAIPYKKATTKKTTTKKTTTKKTTTKKTTSKNRWGIKLTSAEKKLLAQITYLEAGDQSDLGEQAVIVVIFNRMKNSYFKGSLTHVLSSKGQFTTWKNRYRAKPGSREYKNIEIVLNGKSKANNWKYLYFNMSHGKFKYGGHYFS